MNKSFNMIDINKKKVEKLQTNSIVTSEENYDSVDNVDGKLKPKYDIYYHDKISLLNLKNKV